MSKNLFLTPSETGMNLYKNTQKSLKNRIQPNGFALTSVTGAYNGMFSRDCSIQVLSHIADGDAESAFKILKYTLEYHKLHNRPFAMHIMGDSAQNQPPISLMVQVDANYMFVNSYALFAQKFFDRYSAQIKETFEQVYSFAKYFFENDEYFKKEKSLLRNPAYEHGREGRYWDCFDLMTNCFASQGCFNLSSVASLLGEKAAKERLFEFAEVIANGIHTNLVTEIDGKKIYAELIALDRNDRLIKGFSFVTFAPVASDWYKTDQTIFKNTYEIYKKLGSTAFKDFFITSSYVDLDQNDLMTNKLDYVTGKGLAWELWYCFKSGDLQRTKHLLKFLDDFSKDCFDEGYFSDGRLRDTANQEHASWIAYEFARVCGLEKK